MELELRNKILLRVAEIIWENNLSIDDFSEAIKGQEDVLYGIIQGWANKPTSEE